MSKLSPSLIPHAFVAFYMCGIGTPPGQAQASSALPDHPVRRLNFASSDKTTSSEALLGSVATVPSNIAGQSVLIPDPIDDDRTGSTYIPMDSWVYSALERLAAMGAVPSQGASIRPWTRAEARRQLKEARSSLNSRDLNLNEDATTSKLISDLEQELREANGSHFALESVYIRAGVIAGPALTDGFHFGQTWWNDYGRPLGRGSAVIAGYSLRATSNRYFLHARQELQTDPGRPPVTPSQAALLDQLDSSGQTPALMHSPQLAVAANVRQRPIDFYAGAAFGGNQLSFGKQELFWGPTTMGPWSFSKNAEPTYNLRFVATRPHLLPIFPRLGSYRFDLVFGKLSGHKYPARPYFNGQKVNFLLGPYLEVGFTRWSVLWGVGHPMTLGSLKRNLFSAVSTGTDFSYGDRTDPGDRKSGFDFRLHVPGLRKYVTIYADSYADDELSPLNAPRRVAWQPGIYLARLPWLRNADLRFEVSSSQELARDEGGTRFFINSVYRDSNTNKGFLLGNAVGRDGRAMEGRLGYWFSARTHVEGGYRQNKISAVFLPGGGTVSDGFVETRLGIGKHWLAEAFVQHERFVIPSFSPTVNTNSSARIQISWRPNPNLAASRTGF